MLLAALLIALVTTHIAMHFLGWLSVQSAHQAHMTSVLVQSCYSATCAVPACDMRRVLTAHPLEVYDELVKTWTNTTVASMNDADAHSEA